MSTSLTPLGLETPSVPVLGVWVQRSTHSDVHRDTLSDLDPLRLQRRQVFTYLRSRLVGGGLTLLIEKNLALICGAERISHCAQG